MDKEKENVTNQTLIQKIKQVQEELPNITLPNMGIITNEKKIEINSQDYIQHKAVREDYYVK